MTAGREATPERVVWLVVKVGVYDQGVCFAASSRAEAEAFTHAFRPDSDGYHGWDIREMALGALPANVRDEPVGKYDQGRNDIVRKTPPARRATPDA